MVYKRYPPEKVPVNIWEFGRDGDITDDDLVKITFENGEHVFVAWRGRTNVLHSAAWQLDEALRPSDLVTIWADYGFFNSTFSISEKSGFVGQKLRLDLTPANHWRLSVWFITDSPIKSIRPAQRSRAVQASTLTGKVEVSESDDYH